MTASAAVLVLFYEKPEQTLDCLASFLPSGAPLHVLNNGSSREATRRVAAFAAKHPSIHLWTSDRNLGVSGGRNELIRRSAEEWLFFVDNDAVVTAAGWRDRLAAHAAGNPDAEAFVPSIYNVHAKSAEKWGDVVIKDGVLTQIAKPAPETNIFGGTAIVRRSLFDRLGLFDDAMFVGFEDLEIAVRAIRAGAPIRARHADDITLVHDHRRARTLGDRRAVEDRYRKDEIRHSYEHLVTKYGLVWDHQWERWITAERGRMLGGAVARGLAALRTFVARQLSR